VRRLCLGRGFERGFERGCSWLGKASRNHTRDQSPLDSNKPAILLLMSGLENSAEDIEKLEIKLNVQIYSLSHQLQDSSIGASIRVILVELHVS
jgi:hypothetical protein